MKVFQGPADPTLPPGGLVTMMGSPYGACSYASNYLVFGNTPGGWARLPASFPDGTSNSIAFAESYVNCGGAGKIWTESNPGQGAGDFNGGWFGSGNNFAIPYPQFAPAPAACWSSPRRPSCWAP